MKTCKACGEEKPLDHFHKDRSKSDGLNLYCKPCTIAKQRVFQARPPRRKDPEGLKTCQHCKALKPLADYHAKAGSWDGLQKRCKACQQAGQDTWRRANLEKVAAGMRRRRAANPERFADYSLKNLYGLAPGDYDQMLATQDGRCAICKTDDTGRHRRFHVDHCHDTQEIRGLLCHGCNVSLGHFKHDVAVLEAAIGYLSRT